MRKVLPTSFIAAAASTRSPRSSSLPVIGASSGVTRATRSRSPDTSMSPVPSRAFCGPMNTGGVDVGEIGARGAGPGPGGRGRGVIDDQRARRAARRGQHAVDRGVIGHRDVDPLGAVDRGGGVGEHLQALGRQRRGAGGGAVPHPHGVALAVERTREVRAEEAGAEDGDHGATVPRPRARGRDGSSWMVVAPVRGSRVVRPGRAARPRVAKPDSRSGVRRRLSRLTTRSTRGPRL
jgi:hypothetical protein